MLEIINVKIDSRKVKSGDLFVALKGNRYDGHDYIMEAINNGASKVVIEKDIDVNVDKEIVNDTYKWLIDYVSSKYESMIKDLNIVGITGTNGKTTSAYLTYQILNQLGDDTAYIGTIGYYLPSKRVRELPNTTPNILDLYELIIDAKNNGCKNIIMEVSSHALQEERTKGIVFKLGAFTNLTQDHLDYHKTMDNYLKAKMLLLKQLDGAMLINADDSYAPFWSWVTDDIKTFGYYGKDYQLINYRETESGTLINFSFDQNDYYVETKLRSKFNVYNYMLALSLVNNMGHSIDDIIKVTSNVYPPKGRCELIKLDNSMVVIDYAHTPDALDNVIMSFNENKKGRVITVVGCGGDRDNKKRAIMGNVATLNSDYVIFTNDNPRTENPEKIMNDILLGVKTDNYEIIYDRREAIRRALDLSQENDIVLILGKGHEDYQILGHDKIHFDDSEEVFKYKLKKD